ncbi:chemotaxis protein, partial [Methylobacterium indicum]
WMPPICAEISSVAWAVGVAVEAIGTIAGRIGTLSDISTTIAAAVEEQGVATQEIVRNISHAAAGTGAVTTTIQGVADAAGQTGGEAGRMLTVASSVSREAEHLSTEVTRFLSRIRAA